MSVKPSLTSHPSISSPSCRNSPSSPSSSSRPTRSPKRVKPTPSPDATPAKRGHTVSSGYQCPASSGRPWSGSIASNPRSATETPPDRREDMFNRNTVTSPCKSLEKTYPEDSEGLPVRRRELSVPLLSHTLSHFSLCQSNPPLNHVLFSQQTPVHHYTPTKFTNRERTPTSSAKSHTPRRPPARTSTPFPSGQPRDHKYPSTAPLPHISTFLGSPFSTKTVKGRYLYDVVSPSKAVRTEKMGQGVFEQMGSDWLGRSEWMADEGVQDEDTSESEREHVKSEPDPTPDSSHSRRIASGSTSSMEEISGSGTSSASLISLGRNPSEQHVHSSLIAIWGEETESSHRLEEDPSTLSRQYFAPGVEADSVLQPSAKTGKNSPRSSPLNGTIINPKSPTAPLSTLQQFNLLRSASPKTVPSQQPSPLRSKLARTAVSAFLPRILSSKKVASLEAAIQRSRSPKRSSHSRPDEEDETDTEGAGSINAQSAPQQQWSDCQPRAVIQNGENRSDTTFVAEIGLGIQQSAESRIIDPLQGATRTAQFCRSVSSESSGEIDASPSKFLSLRASANKPTPELPIDFVNLDRRKTLLGPAKASLKSTPVASGAANRPTRPFLRRGITEPRSTLDHTSTTPVNGVPSSQTPFAQVKPSPAAFASTGLVRKNSGFGESNMFKFGKPKSAECFPPVKAPVLVASQGAFASGRSTQQTRGLRRKGSTMFASGSSGSIGDAHKSEYSMPPATPRKSDSNVNMPFRGRTSLTVMAVTPTGLGITTPSPTSSNNVVYPFVTSVSYKAISTPCPAAAGTPEDELTSTSTEPPKPVPARLRNLSGTSGPVARSSNPMLAATYKAYGSGIPISSHADRNELSGRLEKDFVLVHSLGSGEFSHVWKVRDKEYRKLWAVKAGKPYTGYKNRLRQLEEVSILRKLSLNPHPHVITFIDSWEHKDRLHIRTELAECGDLSRFLLSVGDYSGLNEARVWKTLVELSSGLQHVHSHNILHLDLKPSNILITRHGSLKIADFGMSTISSAAGRAADLSPALPSAGEDGGFIWTDKQSDGLVPSPIMDREVEGDREYLSPEALGDGQVGRAADVFSLGILLLEAALNVVLPSNGDGWVKLRNDDFSDLGEHYRPRGQVGDDILPEISHSLMDAIQSMMTSRPEGRLTLEQLRSMAPMGRIEEMGQIHPALVEEDAAFIRKVLAE